MIEQVEIDIEITITNEWKLYEDISDNIREGLSANKVLADLEAELFSVPYLEDRDVVHITIPGMVFGVDEVTFTAIVEGWLMRTEDNVLVIDVEIHSDF